jgi:hypothetical protein
MMVIFMKTLLIRVVNLFVITIIIGALQSGSAYAEQPTTKLDVKLITDEAEAVLTILARQRQKQPIKDEDWQRLFNSEGYTRLQQRERSMQRPFEESDFKTFVLSEQLASRENELMATLEKWRKADINAAASRSLAYLPNGAQIRAKIYPVIKPRDNSFVFDIQQDPAIFLYLDPAVTKEQFENTLSHELHHIGYGGNCPTPAISAARAKSAQNQQILRQWMSGLGEGFAMLAAAGGTEIHPHQYSKKTDHDRWDSDMKNFNQDLKKLEKFFLDILNNSLSEEERNKVGYSFFGIQGPWYTVGWQMAVTIEQVYGREKLIEVFCDNRLLLSTYNQAAAKYNSTAKVPLALYSSALMEKIDK